MREIFLDVQYYTFYIIMLQTNNAAFRATDFNKRIAYESPGMMPFSFNKRRKSGYLMSVLACAVLHLWKIMFVILRNAAICQMV